MNSSLLESDFEKLLCLRHTHGQDKAIFTPVEHDLIILRRDGVPWIVEKASFHKMTDELKRSNNNFSGIRDGDEALAAALTLIRFDEQIPGQGTPSQSDNDWEGLWPYFDLCGTSDNDMDFVSKLRQDDSHCHSCISKSTRTEGSVTIECKKISYSLNISDKHKNYILLAHHFHKVNGEAKEMIRMATCGVPLQKIGNVLCKALKILKIRPSESDSGHPDTVEAPARIPHPKAIIYAMLEFIEEICKTQIKTYRDWIEKSEKEISKQRDPSHNKPKGFEISYLRLSEASIGLVEIRQKVQYLLSSISTVENMNGLPSGCKNCWPVFRNQSNENRWHGTPQDRECGFQQLVSAQLGGKPNGSSGTGEERLCRQWWHQLWVVRVRLQAIRDSCQQHSTNIENLQERVKGILSIVSVLLAERENERGRKAQEKRQQTSENQLEIIRYQVKMLENQEIIVARTKRDNTVMKVIAVLTALFLPGTFIATVFSVPVFAWGEENPIGPHFMTYWYFTVPITTILVIGFSVWFLKMWYEDKQAEKRRVKPRSQDDAER